MTKTRFLLKGVIFEKNWVFFIGRVTDENIEDFSLAPMIDKKIGFFL